LSQNPTHHLAIAGDAVRDFNHLSRSTGDNWQYPGHSYDAVGNLAHLIGMLEQAIEQSIRPVLDTHEHGRVLVDGGGDADQAVRELKAARDDAMRAAGMLTAAVRQMHNTTAPMGLDTTDLPEFEDYEEDA
jgi:hypothetical protein